MLSHKIPLVSSFFEIIVEKYKIYNNYQQKPTLMQLFCHNNQADTTIFGSTIANIMKCIEVGEMVYPGENRLAEMRYGAVLEGTRIQLPDGERKDIARITEREYILAAHDVKVQVKDIKKYRESVVYRIEASNGKCLNATAEQCLLTKNGWKRARMLMPGDEIMHYDFQLGRAFYALTSIEELLLDKAWAYSIALNEKTFIANGFICCDYDMQHGNSKTQRRKEDVCE